MLEKLALGAGFRLAIPGTSMRSIAVLSSALLLFSSAAFAQAINLQLDVNTTTNTSFAVGPPDCLNTHVITWTASLPSTDLACTDLFIWFAPNACEEITDGGTPGEFIAADVTNNTADSNNWMTLGATAQTINFTTNQLTLADGGSVCDDPSVDNLTFDLCGAFLYTTSGQDCASTVSGVVTPVAAAPPLVTFTYDSLPPPIPILDSVVPGDTTVTATGDGTIDTNTFNPIVSMNVSYRTSGFDGGAPGPWQGGNSIAGNQGSVTISGLTDGQSYDFAIQATDTAGNTSNLSEPQSATPILTNGFFGQYLADNGHDRGGCASAAGLVPWLALWAVRRVTRRRAR
jgi:hypothetical protein